MLIVRLKYKASEAYARESDFHEYIGLQTVSSTFLKPNEELHVTVSVGTLMLGTAGNSVRRLCRPFFGSGPTGIASQRVGPLPSSMTSGLATDKTALMLS